MTTSSPTVPATDDRRFVVLMLRQLKRLEAAQADDDAWLEAASAEHDAESAQRRVEIQQLLGQIESVAGDLRTDDSQHIDVPGLGRIQFRTTAAGLRVSDAAEAMKWVEEHEMDAFVRVKRELIVTEFKKYASDVLASDGEVLPGIEETPEVTSMSIQWRA